MPSQTSEVAPRWEGYKKTTQAALGWLLDRDPDAWEHLIAICKNAVSPLNPPTPDIRIERKPDGVLEFERNDAKTRRRFVEGFLPKFFKTYADANQQEILAAANRGEFQRVGYQCRNALIDEIRKHTAQKRTALEFSIDAPIPGLDGERTYAEAIEDRQTKDSDYGVGPSFQQRVRGRIEELGGFEALAREVGPACVESLRAALETVSDPSAFVVREDGRIVDALFETVARKVGISTRQLRRDMESVRIALAAMAARNKRSCKAH